MEKVALIAVGSNLGNPIQTVSEAMERLQALSEEPILKSSLWQSSPVDCPPDSPQFVNAAIALAPSRDETPETLLSKLQELERQFGRTAKTVHNEARPLDLDLIAFGNEIRNSHNLTLPHPRAQHRKFVLQPLSEIAPDYMFPGSNGTIVELLSALQTDETLIRIQ